MDKSIEIVRNPQPMGSQVEAITNLKQNLLISAGAGSGKTWVLTERYLEMLSKGFSPSQIVAITFTKKAAGEMKGRIRKAIQKMARQAVDSEEKKYWDQCEQEFRHSIITTIDGFCAELLQAHPLEAQLSPRFRVLDGVEADLVKSEIYTQTVRQMLDGHEAGEKAAVLYQELSGVKTIVSHALAVDQKLKTYHKTPQDFMDETSRAIDRNKVVFQQRVQAILGDVDGVIEEMKGTIAASKEKKEYMLDMEDWFRRYESLRDSFADCGGEPDELLYQGLVDLHWNRWTSPGRGKLAEGTRILRKEKLQSLFETLVPTRYRVVMEGLLDIVEQAEKRYQAYKRKEQAVDFHDLEIKTVQLLKSHPPICEKWQRRLAFLMIDEFQDTNELQKNIMDYLSGYGQKIKLFVVGDGKQSIYRFRGADIEVFYQVEKEIVQQDGIKLTLARNFRSQHGVIEYINSLFQQHMVRDEHSPAYVTQYEKLEAHRVTEKEEPHVEFLCTKRKKTASPEPSEEGEEELSGVEEQADLIARRVKQMVEEGENLVWRSGDAGEGEQPCSVTYGDVAVLLATRSKMHLYEFAFQEYGIPYVVIGGRLYFQKQEILDLINLLRMIQNEEDEVSLLAFLRSPFAQLKDETLFWMTRGRSLCSSFQNMAVKPEPMEEEQWHHILMARERVNRWRREKSWQPASDLLASIVDETGYRMMLIGGEQGDQKVANVDKFLHLVRRLVDEQGLLLYDILEHFKQLQEEEIKEEEASVISDHGNAVVIMSIHASKGLEFPVVFIPELEKDHFKKGDQTMKFHYHPGNGGAIRLKDLSGDKGKDGPGHGMLVAMKQDEEAREIQEAIRLLYVAMTRAKDHLVLFGTEWDSRRKPKFSWLELLMTHLGWETLEQRHEITEPVQHNDWKMSILREDGIPSYPKKSEYRSRLEDWVCDPQAITERDLPQFPLLSKADDPYPWLAPQVGSHLPRLSASALMLYEKCQRKFYLHYVLGIYGLDEILAPSTVPKGGMSTVLTGAERGTIVHQLLETEIDGEEQLRQAVVTMLEGRGTEDLPEVMEEIRPYLAAYRSFAERQGDLAYETEKSFTYLWDGHPLYGQIDRIVYHPDGEVTLYDFKTNRVKESIEKAARVYHLQGYLYVELVEQVMKRKVKSMKFLFLERDKEYDLPLDPESRSQFCHHISTLLAQLREKVELVDYACCGENSCVCGYTN